MMRDCGWKEEAVVDFVLGELADTDDRAFRRHLHHCESCRARLAEWRNTLAEEEKVGAPPPPLKRRLMRNIKPKRPLKLPTVRRPVAVFLTLCAGVFLFLQLDSFSPSQPSPSQHEQPVSEKVRAPMRPNVQQVQYIPVSDRDRDVNGHVWLNPATNEMLLLLDGVSYIHGKNYRAWLVSTEERADAGRLRVENGKARLYFHGRQLEDVRHIIVSVEPHGGGEKPTGPETFMIPLKQ